MASEAGDHGRDEDETLVEAGEIRMGPVRGRAATALAMEVGSTDGRALASVCSTCSAVADLAPPRLTWARWQGIVCEQAEVSSGLRAAAAGEDEKDERSRGRESERLFLQASE
jgi:hypothetical protein